MIWYACPRKKNVAQIDNIEITAKNVPIYCSFLIVYNSYYTIKFTVCQPKFTLNIHMIYADTDVCKWHVNQLNINTNLNVAIYQVPYPFDPKFADTIKTALLIYDQIIILISELHFDSVEFCLQHQDPKIKYFSCGFIDGLSTIPWMDWFITTVDFYKHSIILTQLRPYDIKPKAFDILLGWAKPHRQQIYNYVNSNNLNHKAVMTYLQDRSQPLQKQLSNSWVWPNIEIPKENFQSTITCIRHEGKLITLSQVISTDIYNQTAYSVVAETNFDNHYNFYTEKIVKPILAERLFIVFAGKNYLKNLQKLGFKTFDGIIDESYDSIDNNEQRFNLALEQMQLLMKQPQEEILAKIRPITEHNKQVMLNTEWYGNFSRELQAVVLDQQEQN